MHYFTVSVLNSWDPIKNNKISNVNLLSFKFLLGKFPKVEYSFFDDLKSNLKSELNYLSLNSIKRIVGTDKEDYELANWSFLWGLDFKYRSYQLLIQSSKEGKGTIAAVGPVGLASFFDKMKWNGIIPTLSLLNSPDKMKFLVLLTPSGESIAKEKEQQKLRSFQVDQIIDRWNSMKNIEGQWFPSFKPTCPVCNELMEEFKGYEVGFGQIICPRCGYSANKSQS